MAAGFGISITATDGATAVLNRINAALTRMNAPVARLATATRALGDRTGLSRLATGFQHAADGARMLGDRLSSVLPMFGVLTGAATAAGMARLITQWAEFGQNIGRASDRLGISARSLGQWQVGARLAGSSAQSMTQGLTSLRDTLVDAVGGRNDQAVNYFHALGVQFRDARGNARNFEEVLPDLAEKIQQLRDPSLQARVATVYFGSAAEDLLPIIRQYGRNILQVRDEAAALSRTTDEQVARARELGRAWRGLEVGATQAGNAIAAALAPALTPLLERLTRWLNASDGFAGWIERMASGIDSWVQGGGVTRLGDQIAHVADVVDRVISAFGGWEVAIGVLAAAITAKLLGPLASIVGLAARVGIGAAAGAASAAPAAAVGGAAYAAHRMLQMYRETDAGSPERQAERSTRWGGRGLAGGFYNDDLRRDLEPWIEAGERLERLLSGEARPDGRIGGFIGGPVNRRAQDMPGASPMSATMPTGPVAQPGNPSEPRGIRNFNPLNLRFNRWQRVTNPTMNIDRDGFGIYPSMEAGIAQAVRQLQINDRRGRNTLAQQISTWAPPNENHTPAYIANMSRATGLAPGDRLDLTDRATLARLIGAMTVQENSRTLPADVIDRGIAQALGPSVAGPSAAGAAGGTVAVDVNIRGAGPGTTADVRTSGNVDARPPRVERAMPGIDTP